VRHHRRVPFDPPEPTEACPGCGAVLVRQADAAIPRTGASLSCARLFEVTLRGLREEAAADPTAAATVRRADAAYDAQHEHAGDPDRLRAALDVLGVRSAADRAPVRWRTTIADVAADLDVIDLAVLVDAWARSVIDDWAALAASRK
jgi:Family of unknown function (DUF5946)